MTGRHGTRPKPKFYMEKEVANGTIFWQIDVQQNTTCVCVGKVGTAGRKYPIMEHETQLKALKYATSQMHNRKKAGYQTKSGNTSRKTPHKKERSHQPTEPARKSYMERNDADDDTDSCRSSTSSLRAPKSKRYSGVSPLNRRRSLRLAAKGEPSQMDATDFQLTRSETVVMEPALEKMETGSQWERYRQGDISTLNSQSTVVETIVPTKVKRGNTKWMKWRTELETSHEEPETKTGEKSWMMSVKDEECGQKPALMNKQSTTHTLRQQLASSALEDNEPNIFDEPDGPSPSTSKAVPTTKRKSSEGFPTEEAKKTLVKKQSTTLALRRSLASTALKSGGASGMLTVSLPQTMRLKRKVSAIQSPTSAMPSKPQKRAMMGVPVENEEPCRLRKRQSTIQLTEAPSAKKKKRGEHSLETQQSMTVGCGMVYAPPLSQWPLTLPAQVIWGCPLSGDNPASRRGLCIFVDDNRCLFGDENGTVVELSSRAMPTHLYQLPAAVRSIISDGDFIYAGCNNGGLYDLTSGQPRLLYFASDFGQILSADLYHGVVAVSAQTGQVALLDYSGSAVWTKRSKGEFGWMVHIDDTGVYHGHSKGITKYSTLDGMQLWHTDTPDGILCGVRHGDTVFVTSGASVLKMDRFTGKLLQTYSKGKASTRALHSVAVGGGFVFAGGNKIVCYEETSGEAVYILSHQFKPSSMQYNSGRLFCVGQGAMTVVDFSAETIQNAQVGHNVEAIEITPDPAAPVFTPLKRVETVHTQDTPSEAIVLECIKPQARRGKLKVRALSGSINKKWEIQFPQELMREGAKYTVEELRACQAANLYRVFGAIKELES